MNQKFIKILSCPECGGDELILVNKNSLLECNRCKLRYNITDDVPIMFVDKALEKSVTSEIHKNQGTNFNYIDHYQKDAEHFDYFQERRGATLHSERRLREYIISKLPKAKGTILDVGCGSAWVAKELIPKGYKIISMDISLKNTSTALKNYPSENHSAVVADAYSLPFADNSIDYILASEIIEHTPIPERFVQSLFRVLKPGGQLIVTTPYKERLIYSLCIHCNKQTPHHAHLHSFDEKILTSLYKADDLDSCVYFLFANKILMHLRTHTILRYFGFRGWKLIDKFFNIIYNVPSIILVKWNKKA